MDARCGGIKRGLELRVLAKRSIALEEGAKCGYWRSVALAAVVVVVAAARDTAAIGIYAVAGVELLNQHGSDQES